MNWVGMTFKSTIGDPPKPPTSLYDPRLDTLRVASVAWTNSEGKPRRVVDGRQMDGCFRVVLTMELDERFEVEGCEHVAVADDEGLVDAGRLGGESNRARGVERLALDGVVQAQITEAPFGEVLDERVGEVAE